ncbi:MAG: hypothetical protein ACRC7O_15490 [Fimbriiglobus sp.]
MSLFCPSCDAVFTGTLACPRCGTRLITPGEAPVLRRPSGPRGREPIRPTPVVRTVVGVVAAFGLYFAAYDWLSAVAAAGGSSPKDWWATETGRLAGYVLAAVAAGLGGLLAGAGQVGGLTTGLIAGAACAAIPVATNYVPGRPPTGATVVVAAAALVVAGLAAKIGATVWPAVPDYTAAAGPLPRGSAIIGLGGDRLDNDAGRPTAWIRVAVATTLIVFAFSEAEWVHGWVRVAAGWQINSGTVKSSPDTCLIIAGVMVLLAGITGGASTGAGLWHGLLVGAASTGGLVILARRYGEPPAVVGLLNRLDSADVLSEPHSVFALGLCLAVACGVAGWFGGVLLPPLAAKRERLRDHGGFA